MLHLTPQLFGIWAGISVHDTSSVIGAASLFSDASVNTAVIIKAIRTLFIIPVALGVSFYSHQKYGWRGMPWFLGLFLGAIAVTYVFPAGQALFQLLYSGAKTLTLVAMLLLGISFSTEGIREGGFRLMVFATLLWGCVSVAVLGCILLI